MKEKLVNSKEAVKEVSDDIAKVILKPVIIGVAIFNVLEKRSVKLFKEVRREYKSLIKNEK